MHAYMLSQVNVPSHIRIITLRCPGSIVPIQLEPNHLHSLSLPDNFLSFLFTSWEWRNMANKLSNISSLLRWFLWSQHEQTFIRSFVAAIVFAVVIKSLEEGYVIAYRKGVENSIVSTFKIFIHLVTVFPRGCQCKATLRTRAFLHIHATVHTTAHIYYLFTSY